MGYTRDSLGLPRSLVMLNVFCVFKLVTLFFESQYLSSVIHTTINCIQACTLLSPENSLTNRLKWFFILLHGFRSFQWVNKSSEPANPNDWHVTDPPDSIPLAEFMRNEKYGRYPVSESRNPFTCGLTRKSYSVKDFFQRSEQIAKAFSKRLRWNPNEGTPWDKVLCIFSLNNVSSALISIKSERISFKSNNYWRLTT